eukprot:3506310-Rhodomonas_salina.2
MEAEGWLACRMERTFAASGRMEEGQKDRENSRSTEISAGKVGLCDEEETDHRSEGVMMSTKGRNRRVTQHVHSYFFARALSVALLIFSFNTWTTDAQQAPVILKYKPVWQWINPALENQGIEWPAGRPEGEVKECTCAYLSYPALSCIDSASQGRSMSFPCGIANARRRTGHDELMAGMRPRGPCFCETTAGENLKSCATLQSQRPPLLVQVVQTDWTCAGRAAYQGPHEPRRCMPELRD